MSVALPYNDLHTQLTPEQNKAALEKVAEIIKQNQLRAVGVLNPATKKPWTLVYDPQNEAAIHEQQVNEFMTKVSFPQEKVWYCGIDRYRKIQEQLKKIGDP